MILGVWRKLREGRGKLYEIGVVTIQRSQGGDYHSWIIHDEHIFILWDIGLTGIMPDL